MPALRLRSVSLCSGLGVEVCGDVARVSGRDAEVGHAVLRIDGLGILHPIRRALRIVRQFAGQEPVVLQMLEGWAGHAARSFDAGDDVATGAAVLVDGRPASLDAAGGGLRGGALLAMVTTEGGQDQRQEEE